MTSFDLRSGFFFALIFFPDRSFIYVYSLEMSQRGVLATNLEKLLLYSLDDRNSVNDNCNKMIIKIYDHFQLSLHQIENADNIFANSIEEAKESLKK